MKNNPKKRYSDSSATHPAHIPPSFDEEEEVLRRGLENNPGNIDFCFRLVELLKARNEEVQAFEILAQSAWECLGHGRFTSAIRLMEKMLELRPDHIQTHIEIGKTHLQLGLFEKALESFARAFDAYLATEKLARCETTLGLMARIDPDATLFKIKKAELMAQTGRIKEALALYFDCARALEKDGPSQDFLEVGQRILELDPEREDIRRKVSEALLAEATAFINYGLLSKATKALRQAIAFEPDQVEAYLPLTRVLIQAGRAADATESLLLAAPNIKNSSQKREILRLARKLPTKDPRITKLATELESNLNQARTSGHWPIISEDLDSLANEATSPGYSIADFQHELPRDSGLHLQDSSVVNNLIFLLETLNKAPTSCQMIVQEADSPERLAEIFISQGRVLAGLRIRNQCFIDEELRNQDGELARQLRQLSDALWLPSAATEPGKAERLILSAEQRQLLTSLTAHGLITLAEIATTTPLKVALHEAPRPSIPLPTSSPTSLLMNIAARFGPPSEAMNALFEDAEEFGDECWLMTRSFYEPDAFLPLRYRGNHTDRLDKMLAIVELARAFAAQAEKLREDAPPTDYIGLSYIVADGAWGALLDEHSILLGRCTQTGIGRLLSRIQRLTNKPEP